jgi:hypothetical protein
MKFHTSIRIYRTIENNKLNGKYCFQTDVNRIRVKMVERVQIKLEHESVTARLDGVAYSV